MGSESVSPIHSTMLAEKIKKLIPSLEVHNSKSGLVLCFSKDTGDAVLGACHPDPGSEAVILMRAAKIERNELFQMDFHYEGSLCDEQYDKLPTSLSSLMDMILEGTNAEQKTKENEVMVNVIEYC